MCPLTHRCTITGQGPGGHRKQKPTSASLDETKIHRSTLSTRPETQAPPQRTETLSVPGPTQVCFLTLIPGSPGVGAGVQPLLGAGTGRDLVPPGPTPASGSHWRRK